MKEILRRDFFETGRIFPMHNNTNSLKASNYSRISITTASVVQKKTEFVQIGQIWKLLHFYNYENAHKLFFFISVITFFG